MATFLHSLTLGVDVLELDVVISRDEQVVVSHEPWLSARLGPGPNGQLIDPLHEREYNLYQLPYATIRRCLVGEQPHPEFPTQQPLATYRPLLRDVLQATEAACQRLSRPLVGYSVELKSTPAGDDLFHPQPVHFVELVLAELAAAAVLSRATLLSFDARILQAARQLSPALALCLLSEDLTPVEVLFHQLGFVPETFGPDFQLLSERSVKDLAAHYPALRLVPWTINMPSDLQQAIDWGVAGITTDYPDRLLRMVM
jgi:glycerophosphoryl diester phosphodiesterase